MEAKFKKGDLVRITENVKLRESTLNPNVGAHIYLYRDRLGAMIGLDVEIVDICSRDGLPPYEPIYSAKKPGNEKVISGLFEQSFELVKAASRELPHLDKPLQSIRRQARRSGGMVSPGMRKHLRSAPVKPRAIYMVDTAKIPNGMTLDDYAEQIREGTLIMD